MVAIDYVRVRLAGYDWSFDLTTPPGDHVDELTVLAGLDMSWSMSGDLWPVQPDPMRAQVTVNVPDFADAELAGTPEEPDRLDITVRKGGAAGTVVAYFAGDVTDHSAVTRRGRPGVFVSVVAVDYTVRRKTFPPAVDLFLAVPGAGSGPINALELLRHVWAQPSAGHGEAGATIDQNIFSTLVSLHSVSIAGTPIDGLSDVSAVVDQLLLQEVDPAGGRLIVSPLVDADGYLYGRNTHSTTVGYEGQIFTLDPIALDDLDLLSSKLTIPGSAVETDSLKWSNVRAGMIDTVGASGWGGESSNLVKKPAWSSSTTGVAAGLTNPVVPVTLENAADAAEVATFYADLARWDPWQVDVLRVPVTRSGLDFPGTLWPRHDQPVMTGLRSDPYCSVVVVDGLDGTRGSTRTPNGFDEIRGLLMGCRLTIDQADVDVELSLRRTYAPKLSRLTLAGYGQGPYGSWTIRP